MGLLRSAFTTFLFVLTGASYGASGIVETHPAQFAIDAMLNEPLVLQLEVAFGIPVDHVDLRADGLQIQREIKVSSSSRRVFLIEPDTSVIGHVNGQIAIVDKEGNTLTSVPITGEIKPYIRVAPSRVFLGSLEYGTTSGRILEKRFRMSAAGDWKILHVDVSEMADADYQIADVAADAKELLLRLPEDSLKAGEPFGAFINRTIRITTSNPAQPEVSIPLTAMLSRNGTNRNFNTFVFKGNERWQGKWATPNIAAAVLCPLVLLLLGYGVWLLKGRRRYLVMWRSIATALCLAALVGMIFLVQTYSRGGWVAFGIGLASMIALMKQYRASLTLGAIGFVLIVAALPAGVQRAASAGAVAEDGSIGNRLRVWRGALEMIADHPMGVGITRFGEVFEKYYQEPWHKASYSTAVNDYLTFAAECGLTLVLTILAPCIFLMAIAVQLILRHGDAWAAPVVGGLVTLCVSSLFSSLEFVREVRILVIAGLTILFGYCLIRTLIPANGPAGPLLPMSNVNPVKDQ